MMDGRPRLRILVIENEVLLRLVVQEILLDLGHEIVGWASSAHEAVAEAERQRPDIVLMDIQLDGAGDGIDAAQAIWDRLGIASVFMTGATDGDTRDRALMTRPLGYLQKPLNRVDLKVVIDRLPRASVPPQPPSPSNQARASLALDGGGQPLPTPADAAFGISRKVRSDRPD